MGEAKILLFALLKTPGLTLTFGGGKRRENEGNHGSDTMWFMWILSWIALIVQICLLTLCIAAGLYYLAELVEEYTVMTKRVIKYLILVVSCIYIGLIVFEGMPWTMTLTGLFSTLLYTTLLPNFPDIDLTAPSFILTLILVFVNHYLAFGYFAEVWYTFGEVIGYFTVCLWLVPFSYFVSLSANENTLPTVSGHSSRNEDEDLVSNYFKRKSKKYGLLSFFKYAENNILPQRVKKAF